MLTLLVFALIDVTQFPPAPKPTTYNGAHQLALLRSTHLVLHVNTWRPDVAAAMPRCVHFEIKADEWKKLAGSTALTGGGIVAGRYTDGELMCLEYQRETAETIRRWLYTSEPVRAPTLRQPSRNC